VAQNIAAHELARADAQAKFNGVRKVRMKWLALTGDSIEPFDMASRSPDGPKCIREVLLNERDFRLNGNLDVGKGSEFAAIRRHSRQNPSAAFLVHQTARPVDGVGDHTQGCFGFRSAARQGNLSVGQPLRDQDDGRPGAMFRSISSTSISSLMRSTA